MLDKVVEFIKNNTFLVGIAAFLVVAIIMIFFLCYKKLNKEKNNFNKIERQDLNDDVKISNNGEELVEIKEEFENNNINDNNDEEEDVLKMWDKETRSYTIIRISRGFSARLSQSSDEVKNYYDIIKNKLLSYKNVKSKMSFKHESFKIGRKNVAKLKFRGKTLCLYLALDPKEYENTKYKVEDMSSISNSKDVPTMYRINLPRRLVYAKDLIESVMNKLETVYLEREYINYSSEYPYLDNETLLEKGLIKKVEKTVGEGPIDKVLVNPVKIVNKVNVNEVNNLISNEIVEELVHKSTRVSDKTRKAIVNVDTLSQCFKENEKVTLEEVKKRVRGFDKRATYYKVLARGTIDKALIVDADDFSIEAEKMIILTGGEVFTSKK